MWCVCVTLRAGEKAPEPLEWGREVSPEAWGPQTLGRPAAVFPSAALSLGRNRKLPAAVWGEQIFAKGGDGG